MIGLILMIIGVLVYIGTFVFALMSNDFDELRLATILSFMGVVTFMLGSIIEHLMNINIDDKEAVDRVPGTTKRYKK